MSEEQHSVCTRHPDVETRLQCSRCGTNICPRCLVHTPVGARCPDCAQLRRLPIFELDATSYMKALGAGVVLAGVLGALWGLLFIELFRIPFLPWLVTIGIGYLTGEGISVAVNRKRGRSLQYIAGGCMVLSYVVAGVVSPLVFVFTFPDILFIAVLVIAIFVAAGRVS
ncbi:MAG: hypothetical protein HYX93_02250 [Chloroflexi bacterium]|nr:hypothetical protein [Chloroflexota bacterium]